MKKVIVISTSLRPGSNSYAMAEQFAKGAEAAGHQVEFVSLRGKEIKFCIGWHIPLSVAAFCEDN